MYMIKKQMSRRALKKLFLCSLAEALKVGAVGVEDECGEEEADGQKEFKVSGLAVAGDDHEGKDYRRYKRGDRNDMRERKAYPPKTERDERWDPCDGEENPEGGRHAFASLELEPDREAMPQDSADAQKQLKREGGPLAEKRREDAGDITFKGIQQKDGDPPFLTDHAGDVGGSDIIASMLPYIEPFDTESDHKAEGNGTQEISRSDKN